MACDANINGLSLFGVVVLGWWCYYMNTRNKTPQTSLQVCLIEKHISFSFTSNKKFNWLIQQTKKPPVFILRFIQKMKHFPIHYFRAAQNPCHLYYHQKHTIFRKFSCSL